MLDTDVITELHAGNLAALQKIQDSYRNTLTYFGLRFIDDPDEVKGYLNETFHKLWKLREKFDTLANIKAFLFFTLRNALIDELRRRKSKTGSYKGYSRLSKIHEEIPAEEKPEVEQLQNYLHFLLSKLPPLSREILRLHFLEGLDRHEIAEQLGISVDTVSTTKSRAVKKLRKMAADGEIPGWNPLAVIVLFTLMELTKIN